MPRRVSSTQFVGREPELAVLSAGLDRAASGRLETVFIAGESGVGKSRLLAELEREASQRGLRVLHGECVGLAEGEMPLAPVAGALRGLTRELDDHELDELLGAGRTELSRLLPELGSPDGERPRPPDPVPAQGRLFEFILALLGRLGDLSPPLVAIEDIHWADRSTLDLIAFLMANAREQPLMLVCTYRVDELHRRHPLRPFLARHERPPAERLTVRAFTDAELAIQLEGILGTAPDVELIRQLHARTGGNAFFAEELLAAAADGSALPASLRDALMLRIEALSPTTQSVLRVAATHGRVVTHRLLTSVCGHPEPELREALREAVAHHVLEPHGDDAYAFRHALVQETLEADLLPGERADHHLELAHAIAADPFLVSRDGRAAAELSGHWLGAHHLPEALAASVRAGAEAEEVYAFGDARRHYERALELWNQVTDAPSRAGTDEAGLLARAARAADLSGAGSESLRLVGAALERVDPATEPDRVALLRETKARFLWRLEGDTEGAQSEYAAAVELLSGDEPRPERARVLAGLGQILMLRGRLRESIKVCDEALEVARRCGATAEEGRALNTLAGNWGFLGLRELAIGHLREALRISEAAGDISEVGRAYNNLAELVDHDGRTAEAVEINLAGAKRATELGMRDWTVHLHGEAAARLVKLGRLDEADKLTRPALDLEPSVVQATQCAARARLAIARSRAEEAAELLAASEATNRGAGATWVDPHATAAVELDLLRGDAERARLRGREILDRAADGEQVFFTARLHATTARAEAQVAERARAARDAAAAADAATRAAKLADRIEELLEPEHFDGQPAPEAEIHAHACRVEAARAAGSARAADWEAVAARWRRLDLVLDEAYALLRQAECLVADGDREAAGRVVSAGRQMAERCGATWLGGELESLARRGRLDVAGAPEDESPGADEAERLGLTPREREVLQLVAQGLTNRQVGERLFMSEKTASVHVSRILTKLEVGSRVEAATAAQRLGIVA